MTTMSMKKIKRKNERNLHEYKQQFHMKVHSPSTNVQILNSVLFIHIRPTLFMYETVNTIGKFLRSFHLFSSSFNTKMPHLVGQYGYCTVTRLIVNNRSPGHISLVDYFILVGLGMEIRKTFYYVPHHVSGARRYQIIICARLNVLMYEYFKYSYPIYSMVLTIWL